MGEIIDSIIDNTCTELSVETSTIRANAFRENTNLTTFTDPNVINLGDYAFAGSGITRVYFPDAQVLGKGAFANCESLTEIHVGYPSALPESFCYGCGNLQSFPIENVKTFGKSCMRIFLSGRVNPSNSALTDIALNVSENDNIVFGEASLAGSISAGNAEIGNIGRIIADNAYYVGFVENVPTVQTVMIYDKLYYNDAKTPSTAKSYNAKVDDMVIVESTGVPYIYKSNGWIQYIPTFSATFGKNAVNNNRMRSLGFKVKSSVADSFASSPNASGSENIAFIIVDKDYTDSSFSVEDARGLKYLRFEQQDGTLSNVYPLSSIAKNAFINVSSLDLDFSNVSSIGETSFQGTNETSLSFPKAEYIKGVWADSVNGTFKSDSLETISFGDGTNTLTLSDGGIWRKSPNLHSLTLNYPSVVALTGEDHNGTAGNNNWVNTMRNQLVDTPIYNYKGTTTTTITSGSNTNPVMIYGTNVTCVNGDIVSSNSKQYKLTNDVWQEWGSNGNKRPRVIVPNTLVTSYINDKFVDTVYPNYERWGNLNPEVYYETVSSTINQIVDAYTETEILQTIFDVSSSSTFANLAFNISVVDLDVSNAINPRIEVYFDDVLQSTINLTTTCNLCDRILTDTQNIKIKLYWSGTLTIYWQVLAKYNLA